MDPLPTREEFASPPGITATPPVLDAVLVPRSGMLDFFLAGLAWLVLIGVIGYVVSRNMIATARGKAGSDDGSAMVVQAESQGHYIIGAVRLGEILSKSNPAASGQLSKAELGKAAEGMKRGPYSYRIRYAVLVGELEGPTRAHEELARLEVDREAKKVTTRDVSIEAVKLLDKLYKGYEKDEKNPAITLDMKEQETLRTGLRWYGELALAPEGMPASVRDPVLASALKTTIAYLIVSAAILFALVIGLAFLLTMAVLALKGKIRSGLSTGLTRGGVYIETFTLYMLLFLGMGLGMRELGDRFPAVTSQFGYLVGLAVMFLSLAALAWPVMRGIPWAVVREDIGLTFGGTPIWNIVLGGLSYLAAVPVLAFGIVLMFLIARALKIDLSTPGSGPSHPIINVALQDSWWVWVQVFLVAAVGAPIVEEIMFRGVLYRHLRELSGKFAVLWSVVVSVGVSGFIFAVIHPQGWLGVPALMALATVFALVREWRKSLVPAMVAHALNNGFALLMLYIMVG